MRKLCFLENLHIKDEKKLLPKYNQFYNDLSKELSKNLHYRSAKTHDVDSIARKSKARAEWDERKLHMHAYPVTTSDEMCKTYKKMKGDALKTAILSDFKLSLQKATKEAIPGIVNEYKKSNEYKILTKNNVFFTRGMRRKQAL